MKIYYKLTDKNMQTKNNYQWDLNKWHEIDPNLQDVDTMLCSKHWFHVYTHPLLAILLNPIHTNIINPRLFRCVCAGSEKSEFNLKVGFTKVKLTSEMEVPKVTLIQKIVFDILCAKKVYIKQPTWTRWANDWLNDVCRSCKSADAAAENYIKKYLAIYAANVAKDAAITNIHINLIDIAKKALKY